MVLVFYMSPYVALHFLQGFKKITEIIERALIYDCDHYLQCPKGGNFKSK